MRVLDRFCHRCPHFLASALARRNQSQHSNKEQLGSTCISRIMSIKQAAPPASLLLPQPAPLGRGALLLRLTACSQLAPEQWAQ